MRSRYFAHTLPGVGADHWEPLERHLEAVGALAGEFASAFGAREWGELTGRLHDLGKYSEDFQQYLERASDPDAAEEGGGQGRVDHSTFGAQYVAHGLGGGIGQILAFVIAGHHAGLPNADSHEAAVFGSTLRSRLEKHVPPVDARHLPELTRPSLPFAVRKEDGGFTLGFFTRMLFSALVDADRLATERFCDPHAAAARDGERPDIRTLNEVLRAHLAVLTAGAAPTHVNKMRAEVLSACESAASLAPGLFSLAVPTGGGKTLSALQFALEHAERHGLRRVVMAVPFTSIIEQTADVYRNVLGVHAEWGLLEHHSGVSPAEQTRAAQMAAENWDAPLIVTTNVQLFDSLFASATSPCRKLHRLAGSVIILDEAHTIPVDLLEPTLAALQELVLHYRCSVVLCTATQPALEHREDFAIGLRGVRPIVPEPRRLHESLRRVRVHALGALDDDALTSRLAGHGTVLCILNTRAHASAVYRRLRTMVPDAVHLSTLMCAAHRRVVLGAVRARLRDGLPSVVVSTQLVEAGVDVDFPVVYRAPAGLDSVAQAAGRCNREGRLESGDVYMFDTVREPPPGLMRQAAAVARELGKEHENDPLAPVAMEAYFKHWYWTQSTRWDEHEVMQAFPRQGGQRLLLNFRDASNRYRTIRNEQATVLVPFDDAARRLIDRLLAARIDWTLLRAAQAYLVNLYAWQLKPLLDSGAATAHESGLHVLHSASAYDPQIGLVMHEGTLDARQLIV